MRFTLSIVSLLFASSVVALTMPAFPRVQKTVKDLEYLSIAIENYRQVSGSYPSQIVGLQALVEAKAIERLPKDPWGREYQYSITDGMFNIRTLGRDGKSGGVGADYDFSTATRKENEKHLNDVRRHHNWATFSVVYLPIVVLFLVLLLSSFVFYRCVLWFKGRYVK